MPQSPCRNANIARCRETVPPVQECRCMHPRRNTGTRTPTGGEDRPLVRAAAARQGGEAAPDVAPPPLPRRSSRQSALLAAWRSPSLAHPWHRTRARAWRSVSRRGCWVVVPVRSSAGPSNGLLDRAKDRPANRVDHLTLAATSLSAWHILRDRSQVVGGPRCKLHLIQFRFHVGPDASHVAGVDVSRPAKRRHLGGHVVVEAARPGGVFVGRGGWRWRWPGCGRRRLCWRRRLRFALACQLPLDPLRHRSLAGARLVRSRNGVVIQPALLLQALVLLFLRESVALVQLVQLDEAMPLHRLDNVHGITGRHWLAGSLLMQSLDVGGHVRHG